MKRKKSGEKSESLRNIFGEEDSRLCKKRLAWQMKIDLLIVIDYWKYMDELHLRGCVYKGKMNI